MPKELDALLIERLRDENRRLRRAVTELSVLNDLSRAIAASSDPAEVMRKIAERSMRAISGEQGIITLIEENRDYLPRTFVRVSTDSVADRRYHFGHSLLGWILLNKRPLIVNDPLNDPRFEGGIWDASVRSVVCAPMIIRRKLKGVLAVYNKRNGKGFTDDDQRLLSIIASQSAQVIENARLMKEESALREIERELELASRIQSDLLPTSMPNLSGYDIAGTTIPASKVGGDYFDFIPMAGQRVAVCVGDVSGKQLPAALLMANLQAALRSHTHIAASVRECISLSNQQLHATISPDKFASLFYGILDTREHRLTYCNAGHEPPFLFKMNEGHLRLAVGGTLLGITDRFVFEEASVVFEPGDRLIAYSDGITEATDINNRQFGEERLIDLIVRNEGLTASELVHLIVETVRRHAAGRPQHDDITVVVVRRIE